MFARTKHAITSRFRSLISDEKGATAVEYGLIVGLIAVVLVVAVTALTGGLTNIFGDIANILTNTNPTVPTTP